MGKVVAVALLLACLAGAQFVYNVVRYDVAEPLPLGWTRRAEEVQLLDLMRERRALAERLGAGQRVQSLAGAPSAGPDASDEAALTALDRRIEALEAAVRALQGGGR